MDQKDLVLGIPGREVVAPVHPGHVAAAGGAVAAAAPGRAPLHLGQESPVAGVREGPNTGADFVGAPHQAARKVLALLARDEGQEKGRGGQDTNRSHVIPF